MDVRQKIFLILALAWMVVIFSFSAKDAEVSTQDSYDVGLLIGRVFVPGFEEKTEAEQLDFAAMIDHPVRKTAHAAEYAILGILLLGTFWQSGKKRRTQVLLPWTIATFYAATDELHQIFVPGRSGQISDVILDSTGAAAGIAIVFLAACLICNR